MTRLPACCAVLLLATLAACSKPQPPEKERPVEPQAAQHADMREAIQAPIDKARDVQANTKKAAEAQRAAIDAQVE